VNVFPAFAGPLTPPPGPVAPTPGPEPRTAINATNTPGDANSLFRITQPGSYYLNANLLGVSGDSGIEVAAANVTIDLMGFELVGVAGAVSGITTDGAVSNVTVRNGTIRNWPGHGIDLSGRFNCRIDHVRALSNSASGILVGSHSAVADCTSDSNTFYGLFCTSRCQVLDTIASRNGRDGIFVGSWSEILRCIANENGEDGIKPGNSTLVQHCQAGSNTGHGISAPNDVSVLDCVAGSNQADGIHAAFGCIVSRCLVTQNDLDGIQAGSYSRITDNNCRQSGIGGTDGAGIHVEAANTQVHIEGNFVSGGDRGIDVDGTNCLIARNTASLNGTNYVIAANNSVATIVQAPLSGAVNGSTGGAGIGTTNYWSNLSY
jgi:hypothetical protein